MSSMINLMDLLRHEVMDLYSAEEQIIEALPAMIHNAGSIELKQALDSHLKVTRKQKTRLSQVKKLLGGNTESQNKGFFNKLFGNGSEKCKGMEGLVDEGARIMGEDMSPEVRDAAIIAAAQKIEHYEIAGYGTARAFALELNLKQVVRLLEETLQEEYDSDDLLTELAVGRLNRKAENVPVQKGSNGTRATSRTKASPTATGTRGSNGKATSARSSKSSKTPASKSSKAAPKKKAATRAK